MGLAAVITLCVLSELEGGEDQLPGKERKSDQSRGGGGRDSRGQAERRPGRGRDTQRELIWQRVSAMSLGTHSNDDAVTV